MLDWEPITTGHSNAEVRRSPDGRTFAKTATTPSTRAELENERDRLTWLAGVRIGAPRVLDWSDQDSTLVTSTLPGVPASDLSPADASAAARQIVDFLLSLHQIRPDDCPFDRRLAVTIPLATANVEAGLVDESDFDDVRLGLTARNVLDEVLRNRHQAEALEPADLVVCHGDFCLPNVLLDPGTLTVTGILDVGRLGVADRHWDLALLTRSLASTDLNPQYGPEPAGWVAERTAADPWRIEYYRLLDEFF